MSAATSILYLLLLLLCFLPAIFAGSCPSSNFTCGNYNLEIRYPFFTNTTAMDCRGLYLIQCSNLTPLMQFPGQEFMYPLLSISYSDHTLIIHDLKLSLSPYPWGSDCVFLFDFKAPIPRVNVTRLSLLISSSQSFFNCRQTGYDFSHNIFDQVYNSSFCKDYDIYYTNELDSQPNEGLPDYCPTSGLFFFGWKLSFSEDERDAGDFSLLSAGFSRNWELQLDCFHCRITGAGCPSGDAIGDSCRCSKECQGSNSGKKKKNIIIAGAIAATSGFILASILCFLWYRHNKRKRHPPSTPLIGTASTELSFKKESKLSCIDYPTHVFSYYELQEATNCFEASQELGDGGFGTVYKGKLRDGRIVAVKRLYDNNCKRVEQFINEVAILSRLRHPNLVTLYGCTSYQSRELLLVYEFVPNGTVADHLHGLRAAEGGLTWPLRMTIAIETAEALAYLHAVEPPIIHRDVKTNNILLDSSFHVKVADFGLSRLFPADATHVSTGPQGTPGYLDPEYHQCYQLTDKSDVYSFGVVLVELISSKQAVDINRHRSEINLASMALNRIRNQELEQLVDPGLGYQSDCKMKRVITLVAELAFRCLQMDKDTRPPIREVLEELKGIESNGYKADVRMQDDAGLLKNTVPFSPNSVTEKWVSCSSTPKSSGSGTI